MCITICILSKRTFLFIKFIEPWTPFISPMSVKTNGEKILRSIYILLVFFRNTYQHIWGKFPFREQLREHIRRISINGIWVNPKKKNSLSLWQLWGPIETGILRPFSLGQGSRASIWVSTRKPLGVGNV